MQQTLQYLLAHSSFLLDRLERSTSHGWYVCLPRSSEVHRSITTTTSEVINVFTSCLPADYAVKVALSPDLVVLHS